VKEARHFRQWLLPVFLYALGSLTGAVLVGMAVGFLGSLLKLGQRESYILIGIAFIGILLALSDFEIAGMHTPTLRRQTCSAWRRDLGPSLSALLWGFDLGLGFSTIRVASLYWVLLLVIFVLGSPAIGAAILVGYGLAIPLNLGIGIVLLERLDRSVMPFVYALRLLQPIKMILGITLLLWCLALISLAAYF